MLARVEPSLAGMGTSQQGVSMKLAISRAAALVMQINQAELHRSIFKTYLRAKGPLA